MKYLNPWHKPGKPEFGPKEYACSVTPTVYHGYLIIHRVTCNDPSGNVFDVVRDGRCITQRAGLDGAKRAIDTIEDVLA